MWGRLKNWWHRRQIERERLLYDFFDGRHFRRVDPWRAYRALYGSDVFDINIQLEAAIAGEEPETSKAREAICGAFGCQPFDDATGAGLTDVELFALLRHFLDWCDALQKKTSGSPISSPSAEPTASTGPACPEPVTN